MNRTITQLSQLLSLGLAISLKSFSLPDSGQTALSQSPNEFRTFANWCLNQENLSGGAKHTVQALLRYVETTDCQQASQKVALIYELNLSSNKITDISPISSLTNLSELELGNNQIRDISPISSLTNLSQLNLSSNQIEDVDKLSRFTNLSDLNLRNNQIKDISPLSRLTSLSTLSLRNNQIKDISPLSGLTNLSGLDLSGNPLNDSNCPIEPESICIFR